MSMNKVAMEVFFVKFPPAAVGVFFFFNDTATTEIYTLSLHDALPISMFGITWGIASVIILVGLGKGFMVDQKRSEEHSLNSSHSQISYAVFCLKKKTN